jgi:hypothetical protein
MEQSKLGTLLQRCDGNLGKIRTVGHFATGQI